MQLSFQTQISSDDYLLAKHNDFLLFFLICYFSNTNVIFLSWEWVTVIANYVTLVPVSAYCYFKYKEKKKSCLVALVQSVLSMNGSCQRGRPSWIQFLMKSRNQTSRNNKNFKIRFYFLVLTIQSFMVKENT